MHRYQHATARAVGAGGLRSCRFAASPLFKLAVLTPSRVAIGDAWCQHMGAGRLSRRHARSEVAVSLMRST